MLQGLPALPVVPAGTVSATAAEPGVAAPGLGTILPPGGQPLPPLELAAPLPLALAADATVPVPALAGAPAEGLAAGIAPPGVQPATAEAWAGPSPLGTSPAQAALHTSPAQAALHTSPQPRAAGAFAAQAISTRAGTAQSAAPQATGVHGGGDVGPGLQGAVASPAFAAWVAGPAPLAQQAHNAATLPPSAVDVATLAAESVDAPHSKLEAPSAGTSLRPVAAAPGATGAPGATSVPLLTIARADFQPQLGERVSWMMSQGLQRAELQIDPPHLGRVDITIVMRGEQAQLAFTADTGGGRELLESALPRLRDTLQEAGISLADVNVSARGQDARTHADGAAAHQEPGEAETASAAPVPSVTVAGGIGLLDLYA